MTLPCNYTWCGYNLGEGGWVRLTQLNEDGAIADGDLWRAGKLKEVAEENLRERGERRGREGGKGQ